MRRAAGVLFATVLTLLGMALVGLGAIGIMVFGTSGEYQSDVAQVSGKDSSVALIADLTGAEVDLPLADRIGTTSVGARSGGAGRAVFVGVAPAEEVDAYLFGLPYGVLSTQETSWTTTHVPGIAAGLPLPGEQDFWSASDTGAAATVELSPELLAGSTLVIADAAGGPGITATITLGYRSSHVFPLSVAAVVVGLVMIAVGVRGMLRWGRRRSPAGAAVDGDPRQSAVIVVDSGQPVVPGMAERTGDQ